VGRRILVVEDDPDLRHLYATALALARFDVTTASDGFEALQKIDSDPPDLILLDLGLPFVSGQAIAMEVAARAHSERIAIVIVTGQVIIAPPAAADCVLLKPVPLDELVRTVEHCLTGSVTVPLPPSARTLRARS
jgi:two-component system response regulator MprA